MSLREENLTYKIRGGLFEVHNEVGLGQSEEVYHRAFSIWLTENGVPFLTKPHLPLAWQEEHVMDLIPDLIVDDILIIELKAGPRQLANPDKVQLYNYLKRSRLSLGLLVNMGLDRVHVERHLRDTRKTSLEFTGANPEKNPTLLKIQEMIEAMHSQHQTGYSGNVIDRILPFALNRADLPFTTRPTAETSFRGQPIGQSTLDCMIVNQESIFCTTCLFDDNDFNTSRTRSFMQTLRINKGIAVNFGKQSLQAHFFSTS